MDQTLVITKLVVSAAFPAYYRKAPIEWGQVLPLRDNANADIYHEYQPHGR